MKGLASLIKMDFFSRPYFTGVGSRENVPDPILRIAEEITYVLCMRGYDFRSGRAKGMDEAFERGAARAEKELGFPVREIWLPRENFRKHAHFDPRYGYVPTVDQFNYAGKLLQRTGICKTFFEEPDFIRQFFGRNVFQIIGEQSGGNESSTLSDFVIYYAPENSMGDIKGGTRIAVYLARYLKIPTYNLAIEEQRNAVLDRLGLYAFYRALEDEEWGPVTNAWA